METVAQPGAERKDVVVQYYAETAPDGVVLLGNVRIADEKRQEEEDAGGLVALVCGYGRKPYTQKGA